MRLAMKYPEMFAAAALLSPAVYEDPPANSAARRVGVFGSPDYDPAVWKAHSHLALWSAYQARQLPVPMYVVSGDDDEYLIESTATQFYSLLRAYKQPAELRIVDGAHTWSVWSTTIGDAMKYMFRYTTGPADSMRQQLLTTGRLRAGINAGNALTRVVGTQMARELARRLGTEAVLIEYPTPGAVTEGVGRDWDVAFIAADPERTGAIAFTPPYVELDATYLVREASPIRAVADVDRTGAKIATGRTSAYTLVLRRELTRAELVFPTEQDAIAGLQAGTITALAGLRFGLLEIAKRVPGLRVLPGNITRAQQAIALPKANTAALAFVTAFVADVKANGFVAGAIRQTGFTGARVAP
jgi:ABC-type amino acid transport substrate-binding protein